MSNAGADARTLARWTKDPGPLGSAACVLRNVLRGESDTASLNPREVTALLEAIQAITASERPDAEALDRVIGELVSIEGDLETFHYDIVRAQIQALAELRDRERPKATTGQPVAWMVVNKEGQRSIVEFEGWARMHENLAGCTITPLVPQLATPSEPTPAPAEPEPRESISAMYERDYEHEHERAAERACSHDDWIPTGPERPSAHDWIEREWTCEACGVFVTERFHPTARPG